MADEKKNKDDVKQDEAQNTDANQADEQDTEAAPEPKKNKDGLVPGQFVDFDTIRRVESKRVKKGKK